MGHGSSWTEPNINERLLAAIMDDRDIKQGLYPSPGGKTSNLKAAGNKKTVWQWKLAVILFKNHQNYGSSFAHALKAQPGSATNKL